MRRAPIGMALALLGCAAAQAPREPPASPAAAPTGEACVADALGALGPQGTMTTPACGSGPACGEACLRGDAVACYLRGIELEQQDAPPDAAPSMFLHGCRAGLPIGCTNYAAGLWAHAHGKSPCANRLFERACAADEPFACGMLGRMIVDSATPAQAEQIRQGRELLDRSCHKLGRFPCRVLALEIEDGRFGPPNAANIQALLAQACATGDSDACGSPPSAKSTFHVIITTGK